MRDGFRRRIGREHKRMSYHHFFSARNFSRKLADKFLKPIECTELITPRQWINEFSPYTEKEKKAAVELLDSLPQDSMGFPKLRSRDFKSKIFCKREFYPSVKPPRWILPHKVVVKAVYGAIFKSIEKQVYQLPMFVKHVPRHELANFILDKLDNRVFVTDYTSFECSFDRRVMLIEMQWYAKCLKNFPHLYDKVKAYLLRRNVLTFKGMRCRVNGRRLSGAMNTSLGNGIANFVLTNYMCKVSGFHITGQVFEGDDGIFSGVGTPPTAALAEDCGLLLKIEETDLTRASFCGLIFDRKSKQCIKDVLHTLLRFPWSTSQRMLKRDLSGLLRSKALSLFYELPACPILTSFTKYINRVLHKSKPIFERDWKTRQMLLRDVHNLDVSVKLSTRQLMERVFHIPIDLQLALEAYFDSCDEIRPLKGPLFDRLFEESRTCVDKSAVIDFSRRNVEFVHAGESFNVLHRGRFGFAN
jgi:hypothetical protein